MATKISRLRSSSISSRSDSEKRSISRSPRRGPATPDKSPMPTNDSDDERENLALKNDSKAIADNTSSPVMSDIEENQQKKRSHRHRHHRNHKQPKSKKRPATHHKHSVKRSKKETVPSTHQQKSDEENSVSSLEKITSQSEQSQSEEEAIRSENDQSNDEEGVIEGESPSSERRNRRHRKKQHRSSSLNDGRTSPTTHQSSTSASIPKNNKGTQLIVNYLPASLRESDFYQLFARIAPVKLCKLITDRQTGHSFCYGFIEYHTKEEAVKAIEKFNGYKIEHKKLKVSYAQPKSNNNDESEIVSKHTSSSSNKKNPNIYITELPENFDEKMLERLFSKYGEIVQTKVLRDPRTKISRGVGFVLMKSTKYAERAVKALDGYVPSGSTVPISVKYADPKKTTHANDDNYPSSSSSSRSSRPSSMVGSIGPYGYPPSLPPINMIDPYYAAALHHHHRAAMNMRNVSLSPSPPPLPPPPPAYYNNSGSRSSRMRGSSPGLPRSYSSSSSKHSSNLLSTNINASSLPANPKAGSLAAAFDLISKGCQQAIDPNGFVIYAFGLPNDCDENDLDELFRRYGDVYRVYVVRNYSTGESKGYSFITMSNYEEACHAVTRLDGSTFHGRTIQVRFKQ